MFSADQVMFVFRNQGSKMKKHFISLEPRKTLGQNMRFLKLKATSQNIEWRLTWYSETKAVFS